MSVRPLNNPNPLMARFFMEARRLAQLARDREDARVQQELEESDGIGVHCSPWRYRATREQYQARGLDPYVTPEPGRTPGSGPITQDRAMRQI